MIMDASDHRALGGGDGAVNKVMILRGGTLRPTAFVKEQDISMAPGDMVGLGRPAGVVTGIHPSSLQAVFKDVRLGRVSMNRRKFYGVIVEFTSEGKLSLDEIGSEQERKS